MYAELHFRGNNDSEALALSDPVPTTPLRVEVSGMNCRARIPSATHQCQGDSSVFDDGDHGRLSPIARQLHASHLDRTAMPHVDASLTRRYINEVMEDVLDLLFPGLFRKQARRSMSLDTTSEALERLARKLAKCIDAASALEAGPLPERPDTRRTVLDFLADLPNIRRILTEDAHAAYEGDPAARSVCEVVLAYPGFLAVAAHRLAHRLQALRVPLIPRLMSEWAHTLTGIDIHPGATLGNRAFIDHGTGVVVGETAVIGHNVRIYHGVTLGASSTRNKCRAKRHPTIENDVTLYAHATVLGGTTVVGRNSVVGASVLLAESLPENSAATPSRTSVVRSREQKSEVRAQIPASTPLPRTETGKS